MKIIKSTIIASLLAPVIVFAQSQAILPAAGLTPESQFYFFDTLSENLQRFFAFSPESKARLEITFAKERISEIKIILEDGGGAGSKGLSVAEENLNDNLSRTTAILINQKQLGKDTGSLAKELSNDFDPARQTLKSSFKLEKDALESKIDELKIRLKQARMSSDVAQVEILSKEITSLKTEKEDLENHENLNDENIEKEDEHFDEALGLKEETAEKIEEAIKNKEDLLEEVKEVSIVIPTETFQKFDTFLSQAKAMFEAGNYIEAKNFAKEAKKNLKEVKKSLEKLKDIQEKEDEQNEEDDADKAELEKKVAEADREGKKKKSEELRKNEKREDEKSENVEKEEEVTN